MLGLEPLLEPEELGDLALAAERTRKSLRLGMAAARLAMGRADFRVAVRRLKAVMAIALELGMASLAREASAMIGEALHSLGDDGSAREFLSDQSVWSLPALEDSLAGAREFLLGRIARTLGEIDGARTHLSNAIDFARGERSLWMRSHAELAEIDWEIGTAAVRAEAIRRISSVLDETGGHVPDQRGSANLRPWGRPHLCWQSGERREILLAGSRVAARCGR
jgi:hypothetical protein